MVCKGLASGPPGRRRGARPRREAEGAGHGSAPSAAEAAGPRGRLLARRSLAHGKRRDAAARRRRGAVGRARPESVTVKCGPHTVRLGSSGKPQALDVPCGSALDVGDK